MIISAIGHNVRNALAEARRVAGLQLKGTRVVVDSDAGDGLHRVTLEGGHIVEVTVKRSAKSEAFVVTGETG